MSDTMNAGDFTFTSPARLTFENIFVARGFKDRRTGVEDMTKQRFDASIELPADHPDLKAMKAAAVAIAREKWPARDLKADFKFPWESGDKLAERAKARGKEREFSRGMVVLVARSKFEPALAVVQDGKLVDYVGERRPLAKPFFYRGVSVFAQVRFEAYEGIGANPDGVTAYLQQLCSVNKGEKLGKVVSAAETFKGVAGSYSDIDPTVADADDDY